MFEILIEQNGGFMSRSKRDQKGGHPTPGYDKESNYFKKLWRKKKRLEGKKLMEDAPKNKSTGGWFTW